MTGALAFRPSASPLHAARASVSACWVLALIAASVILYHPLFLATIALGALAAACLANVGRAVARMLRMALIVALPIVLLNVLLSRQGLTVFARLGDLGPFGQGDLTVEALLYGLVIALKVTAVILICALGSLTVDPDDLLSACRRVSLRSALTSSVTLRMIPLLSGDAHRFAQAQRTRPDADSQGRLRRRALLLAATVAGALDRSLDVAATLEVRGFATAGRIRRRRRPRSRHDIAFGASALGVLAFALIARVSGAATYVAYPLLHCPTSLASIGFCVAIALAMLLPFLNRRGIG